MAALAGEVSKQIKGHSEGVRGHLSTPCPLPPLTRPLFLLVANMEEFLVFADNIGVTPVPVIMSCHSPFALIIFIIFSDSSIGYYMLSCFDLFFPELFYRFCCAAQKTLNVSAAFVVLQRVKP